MMFSCRIGPWINGLLVVALGVIVSASDSTVSSPVTVEGDRNATFNETGHLENAGIIRIDLERVRDQMVAALWIFCTLLVRNVFHMIPKLSSFVPESCLLMTVGIVVGLVMKVTGSAGSTLTPDAFFFFMLPPIILNTGYSMPSRLFFEHIGTILIFAIIGTFWNSMSIGLSLWAVGTTEFFGTQLPLVNTLIFSALISAVDPVAVLAIFEEIHVNDILYIIVLGESLLNDAVTVALYHLCDHYVGQSGNMQIGKEIFDGLLNFAGVALGGTLIGIVWGFLTGFVTRFTHYTRDVEPIFIFVMSYLAYMCAELFHMSGILALVFCGMTMKSYVKANISFKSSTTIKYDMKALGNTSEAIIFFFLGVQTTHLDLEWNAPFIALTILFCSVYRAVGVVVLTFIANHFRLYQLDNVEKFVLSYGGLRGAVAFALALLIDEDKVPQRAMFITTTIVMVYFTVFLQGGTIRWLAKCLQVKLTTKRKMTMNERIHEILMDYILVGIEDVLGRVGSFTLRDKFKRIDNHYIRPILIRENGVYEPKILETYSKLAMKDAVELMKQNGSTLALASGAESMGVFFRNFMARHCKSEDVDQLWNLDTGELEYQPSGRDLTETQVRHLSWKPLHKSKQFSFSRNSERDFSTSPQFKYNARMNIRRMISENVLNERTANWKAQDAAGAESDDVVQMDVTDLRRRISMERPPPTAAEMTLPWKREDDDSCPVVQNEFPSWAENKDYVSYFSPSNTFLGALDKDKPNHRTVIGFFGRGAMNRVALFGRNAKRGSKSEASVAIDMPELSK